jgi:UDP-N-acetylglucosamine--N-acetylmuramyl-(pentapeptide) pyrophosphoryl-undecaprenol N-acetylglucosamine transferase
VPLAIAKGHQVDNARLLAEAGGAEMIRSDHFTAERLAARLAELLADAGRLAAMGRAARALARPRAVADIADHLAELGGIG